MGALSNPTSGEARRFASSVRPNRALPGPSVFGLLVLPVVLWCVGCGADAVRPDPGNEPVARCAVRPDVLDFGLVPVGETRTRRVTVANEGTDTLTTVGTVDGAGFHLGAGDTAHLALAPGDSTAVDIVCAPVTEGYKSGSFELAGGSCSGVALTGRTFFADSIGVFRVGSMQVPVAVAVEPSGNVIVSVDDRNYARTKYGYYTTLKTFTAEGEFLARWPEVVSQPQGVAVLADGSAVLVDTYISRVVRGMPTGSVLAQVGVSRYTPGRFGSVDGVEVDDGGFVYVLDRTNGEVTKLTGQGEFIMEWTCYSPEGVALDAQGHVYVAQGETYGGYNWVRPECLRKFSDEGEVLRTNYLATAPTGLAVSPDGFLFMSCSAGIAKLDLDCNMLETWLFGRQMRDVGIADDGTLYAFNGDSVLVCDARGRVFDRWARSGTSLSVAEDGSIYIFEFPTVYHYSGDGTFLDQWGGSDSGEGRIGSAATDALALAPGGELYIADTGDDRVKRFRRDGTFLSGFGNDRYEDAWFVNPSDVAAGADGSFYITDAGNDRVQKFSGGGEFLAKWGRSGTGPGEFDLPRGIAVGPGDEVYVWDTGNGRVQVFDSNGDFLRAWDAAYPLGLIEPWPVDWFGATSCGIAVDDDGVVYLTDRAQDRIVEFDSSGSFLRSWGGIGTDPGRFRDPRDIAVAPDGSLWVSDAGNGRLQHLGRPGLP